MLNKTKIYIYQIKTNNGMGNKLIVTS